MFDESILEPEAIEREDMYVFITLEARYSTYKDGRGVGIGDADGRADA